MMKLRAATALSVIALAGFCRAPAFLAPPQHAGPPLPRHAVTNRAFQGISSLAAAPGGRLWVAWYAGVTPAEDHNNFVVLSTSGDAGKTWREVIVVDPDGEGPVRAFDPELWLGPDGRLRLFWGQADGHDLKVAGVWCMATAEPDSEAAAWQPPARLTDGVMMCKPVALTTGEWVLPAATWHTEGSAKAVVSADRGRSWAVRGACNVPEAARDCDEPMLVERRDGSLWLLARTRYGIGESVSADRGKTWPELAPSAIAHATSRFFITRLASGSLLLVKHGPLAKRTGRSHLTAFVSKDDGRSWEGGLLLDERNGVSYPDGQQAADGTLLVTYDFDRTGARHILFAAFRESDVLAGKPVSGAVRLRQLVSEGSGGAEPLTSRALLNGPGAALEKVAGARPGVIEEGAAVFTDRAFTYRQPPAGLKGMPALTGSIDGGVPVTVSKAGLLTVLTPAPDITGAFCSNAAELETLGFTWIQAPAQFQLFGTSAVDTVRIYQKAVTRGESFTFKKWVVLAGIDFAGQDFFVPNARVARVIEGLRADTARLDAKLDAQDLLVNRPDYVVFIPRQPRDTARRDPGRPGDTYNDHFQVLEHAGVLYAFWTQASREADIDQHIAFSKSADRGESWSEPVILAGSPNRKNPALLASWQQPMFSKSGRLYCLWNQQTTSRGPHCGQMFGAYSDDKGDTWSAPKMVPLKRSVLDGPDPLVPPSWCNWQRPLRLGKEGRYLVGVSRHGRLPDATRSGCYIEFLQFDNIDDDPQVEDIRLSWFSGDEKALRVSHEKFGDAAEEVGLVKLPDGRLFGVMRTSAGHPFWTQSRDDGVTWTPPRPLLDRDGGTPYLHPRSPCPIYDWKGPEAASGTYFVLVHNTFDFNGKSEYQTRGPLYLIAGRFNPAAEQPVEFAPPKLFAERPNGNSFYTSYTLLGGTGVLWFPDKKFYLLGRTIGEEWFKQ